MEDPDRLSVRIDGAQLRARDEAHLRKLQTLARYVWEAELTDDMAASAISLARELVERLRNHLADTSTAATTEGPDEQKDNS